LVTILSSCPRNRQQLKALEDENAKLKKLLAEAMLDLAVLKDVASKKW
jgi:putative transposase